MALWFLMITRPRQVQTEAMLPILSGLGTILRVVGACLLVWFGAQVRVPVPGTDVPMTLQPMAVVLVGLTLGPAESVAAMTAYLACGVAGVPFFTPGSAGLAGPTGGYLIGFLVGAWSISVISRAADRTVPGMLVAGAVGMVVVLSLGTAWRVVWLGGGMSTAFVTGFLPFCAKGVIEVMLAVSMVAMFRRRRGGVMRDGFLRL